jgi:hypothetical protein
VKFRDLKVPGRFRWPQATDSCYQAQGRVVSWLSGRLWYHPGLDELWRLFHWSDGAWAKCQRAFEEHSHEI